MLTNEPITTAIILAVSGFLLIVSVLFSSRATERVNVPVALIFLAIGVLAGSEGIGGIPFADYGVGYRLGTVALVLILFDGGLNTPLTAVRRVAAPAAVLATVGVIGTAVMLALGAYWLGMPRDASILLGAVVSSTDAAAVFAVLRSGGVHLSDKVKATLEIESGSNDPMAVILTMSVTSVLLEPGAASYTMIGLQVISQIAIGLAAGLAIGYGARYTLAHARLHASGMYAVLLIGMAFLAFAVPTLLYGSGFLAVYVGAIVLGNGEIPYRTGLLRVHDAIAWLSQVTMFLLMGLLVFPSRLIEIAPIGLAVSVFLAFVARPVVVWLCLIPFRYTNREKLFVSWVGLRGAVPIILATYPVLAGAPAAEQMFDLVFFVVVVSSILPGATVTWAARKLGLETYEPPPPRAVLAIESVEPLQGELLSFYIDEALAVAGETLSALPFPEGASVTMIVRGKQLLAPRGSTVLTPGDHVYVFTNPESRGFVRLVFGQPESE